MKAALVFALTVYGLAAIVSLLVAVIIRGLFLAVRRFSR